MKVALSLLLVALRALGSLAAVSGRSLRSPALTPSYLSLVSQQQQARDGHGAKLIPWKAKKQWAHEKQRQRMHMIAHGVASHEDKPVEGCIACFGVQVLYGKYQTAEGDQVDNSYYLFRDPARKEGDDKLPLIIHFHHGGFFSGRPWTKENKEIQSYLSKGFAVVSAGYRMVTEKYFYEAEDETLDAENKTVIKTVNKTEELIHVSKEGMLSLDAEGKTMESYKVRVGKQELVTKYLYDATQMMENLINNADKFGLDIHRIVFVGESTGGAGMQYLTWVHHQWNVGRYTPRGMVYHKAQLNYPVHNMLDQTWDLFVETMGPRTKLSDVVSAEACPSIIGNHMCGSPLGESSDYELCNQLWNRKALERFCGEALKSATLGEVQQHQRWPKDAEQGNGFDKLWYNSENMQQHVPHEPFYLYVANSMNGTRAVDVAHHSIFALNFAKFAEMAKEGAIQYTAYYTDFPHMTEADRGMKRLEVSSAPGDLGGRDDGLDFPATASGPAAATFSPGPGPAPSPAAGPAGRAPGPAPAPATALVGAGSTVFNYLSTHGWREDFAGRDVEVGSTEERILYACFAAAAGPYSEFNITNKTRGDEKESGAPQGSLSALSLAVVSLVALLGGGN